MLCRTERPRNEAEFDWAAMKPGCVGVNGSETRLRWTEWFRDKAGLDYPSIPRLLSDSSVKSANIPRIFKMIRVAGFQKSLDLKNLVGIVARNGSETRLRWTERLRNEALSD
jgi:hypothetical protein